MRYVVRGIPQEVADEVRRTRLAPGYGHPAHLEIAGGTGPCRCCLRTFVPGHDRRLLFTYRPPGDSASLMAPGPIFIHADHCEAFAGDGFPEGLRSLPLAFEARGSGSRVIELSARQDVSAEVQMTVLFEELFAKWLHVRHAEAGCYIARVEREETMPDAVSSSASRAGPVPNYHRSALEHRGPKKRPPRFPAGA